MKKSFNELVSKMFAFFTSITKCRQLLGIVNRAYIDSEESQHAISVDNNLNLIVIFSLKINRPQKFFTHSSVNYLSITMARLIDRVLGGARARCHIVLQSKGHSFWSPIFNKIKASWRFLRKTSKLFNVVKLLQWKV